MESGTEKTLTRVPLDGSYSRVVTVALGSPNGHSLLTSKFPLGAIARSNGLNSGSSTSRGSSRVPFWENTAIVLSPSPEGPMPELKYTVPSGSKPNPLGKGTDPSGSRGAPGPSRFGEIARIVPRRRTVTQ